MSELLANCYQISSAIQSLKLYTFNQSNDIFWETWASSSETLLSKISDTSPVEIDSLFCLHYIYKDPTNTMSQILPAFIGKIVNNSSTLGTRILVCFHKDGTTLKFVEVPENNLSQFYSILKLKSGSTSPHVLSYNPTSTNMHFDDATFVLSKTEITSGNLIDFKFESFVYFNPNPETTESNLLKDLSWIDTNKFDFNSGSNFIKSEQYFFLNKSSITLTQSSENYKTLVLCDVTVFDKKYEDSYILLGKEGAFDLNKIFDDTNNSHDLEIKGDVNVDMNNSNFANHCYFTGNISDSSFDNSTFDDLGTTIGSASADTITFSINNVINNGHQATYNVLHLNGSYSSLHQDNNGLSNTRQTSSIIAHDPSGYLTELPYYLDDEDLSYWDLSGNDLRDCDLINAVLLFTNISNCQLPVHSKMVDADLSKVIIYDKVTFLELNQHLQVTLIHKTYIYSISKKC